MPLYSLESPRASMRLASKGVVTDTSYLIAFSDPNHPFQTAVVNSHAACRAANTDFFINQVGREEFLKWVRKTALIGAMLVALRTTPTLESRYRTAAHIPRSPLTYQNLNNPYEQIWKNHVRAGDTQIVLNALILDPWTSTKTVHCQQADRREWTPHLFEDLGVRLLRCRQA